MPLRFQPARGASVLISSSSRGPVGAAATADVGTTTTGAAGTSASVINSGSTSAAVFDFTIPRGADAGIKWLYETSTSMAAPTSGYMRFNNATLSLVTAIAVSATGSGSDVSDYVALWDDSTNTTKAHLVIREEAGSVAAVFAITAVTDNGTWLQLTVTYVSGSLTLSADDKLYVVPMLVGNKGADGAMGGTLGTTDNVVPRADGTTGTTLQPGLFTNDDSGNLFPNTNDTGALGKSGTAWADLFLASGGVINWNASDVTITHSANALAFGGASSGYNFDALVSPSANDAAPLGSATVSWADLFLASGAVVNYANGNFTVTHSSGLLTMSGSLSLGTSNAFTCGSIELGHASANTLTGSSGDLLIEGSIVKKVGKETIFIPAAAMTARTTNGAAPGTTEMATNKNMFKTLDFDTTTQEFAQFEVWFPKSWNLGTVTFQPIHSHASGSGNVVFGLAGVARSSGDAGDVAFGTAQTSDTTIGTANAIYLGPESSAITIAGTPAAGDSVQFQVNRTVASDNLGVDARLHGIRLFFTTNASTDT